LPLLCHCVINSLKKGAGITLVQGTCTYYPSFNSLNL
jgi:hypothetical protein